MSVLHTDLYVLNLLPVPMRQLGRLGLGDSVCLPTAWGTSYEPGPGRASFPMSLSDT